MIHDKTIFTHDKIKVRQGKIIKKLLRMIMILEVLTSCAMIISDAHETLEFISIIIGWLKHFIPIYLYNLNITFDIPFEL